MGGQASSPTKVTCQAAAVKKRGSWRTVRSGRAPGGSYCDNLGTQSGRAQDTLRLTFRGPRLEVSYALAKLAFTDKKSYQFMASQMVGVPESEYVKMMVSGGRSPDGWRSRSERKG